MKLTNNKNYIIHVTLYTVACTLITNSIIQGFMLENGIPEATVMLYLSVIQGTQVCVMFCFSLIVDKIKNIMRLYSASILLQLIMFIALVVFCLVTNVPTAIKTAILFTAGVLTNIDQAILNVLTYKAPYYYIDMNRIGNIQGFVGFLCGLTGAALSATLIFVTSNFNYNKSMLAFFIFGIVLILISFFISKQADTKEPNIPTRTEEKTKRGNIFKYKPFYLLAIPHLMRGFNSGIFVTTMTIGFTLGITDKSSSATLTLILQSAQIFGNFFFSRVSAPRRNVKLVFFSGLCLLVFMPLMVSGNLILFYTMYFLAGLCIALIDASVPCVIVELVDYEYMGQYSSYRMLLHTLGITLSSLVAIPLINILGGVGTMLFSSCLQVCAGTAYFIFMKTVYKKRAAVNV